jgi:hypothetical protein
MIAVWQGQYVNGCRRVSAADAPDTAASADDSRLGVASHATTEN